MSRLLNDIPMMHNYDMQPIFGAFGYHPSVFMESSFKPPSTTRNLDFLAAPRHLDPVPRMEYTQSWVNARPVHSERMVVDMVDPAPSSSSFSSASDSQMEWETCPSLSPEPLPLPAISISEGEPPSALDEVAFVPNLRVMSPPIAFRERSRCIFLGVDPSNPRLNRRPKQLLHNGSVQRIRTWLKDTIQPSALAQWRNMALGAELNPSDAPSLLRSNDECPICFKSHTVLKLIEFCKHKICWKCEQDLNRDGNLSCPMCRRLRLFTTYESLMDLFKTTMGLHPKDYIHPLSQLWLAVAESSVEHGDHDEYLEHELTDRLSWEPKESFMLSLQGIHHPLRHYFQRHAVRDLCFKSSSDANLPEYDDQTLLVPPTSGLVLPPHRLYIALIHFCIDMMTLPRPVEFQDRSEFKREYLLLELMTLFLVPTDEFSPRALDRIYDASAWVEHGRWVTVRIYKFLYAKAHQSMVADDMIEPGDRTEYIPSTRLRRSVLFLGASRWSWIIQSLTVLLTWIQTAQTNPSMVTPKVHQKEKSVLGKHNLGENHERYHKKRRTNRWQPVEEDDQVGERDRDVKL